MKNTLHLKKKALIKVTKQHFTTFGFYFFFVYYLFIWDSWWGETSSAVGINDKIPTAFHKAMHNHCDLILLIKISFANSINKTETWLGGHYVCIRLWHARYFFFQKLSQTFPSLTAPGLPLAPNSSTLLWSSWLLLLLGTPPERSA